MGRLVIACYRPKPGHEDSLNALVRTHVSTLRGLELVTDRVPVTMRAADGTVVEVFEWVSDDAMAAAHAHPTVLRMWEAFGAVCDFVPIAAVPEAAGLFPAFTPVDVDA
jgi:hypothetical protein